jgi:hypothetical protein
MPKSGDILIAVPLSILAESRENSGKMSQVFRAKNKLKRLKFEENCDFILKSAVRKNPKNSGKVAEIFKNMK